MISQRKKRRNFYRANEFSKTEVQKLLKNLKKKIFPLKSILKIKNEEKKLKMKRKVKNEEKI